METATTILQQMATEETKSPLITLKMECIRELIEFLITTNKHVESKILDRLHQKSDDADSPVHKKDASSTNTFRHNVEIANWLSTFLEDCSTLNEEIRKIFQSLTQDEKIESSLESTPLSGNEDVSEDRQNIDCIHKICTYSLLGSLISALRKFDEKDSQDIQVLIPEGVNDTRKDSISFLKNEHLDYPIFQRLLGSNGSHASPSDVISSAKAVCNSTLNTTVEEKKNALFSWVVELLIKIGFPESISEDKFDVRTAVPERSKDDLKEIRSSIRNFADDNRLWSWCDEMCPEIANLDDTGRPELLFRKTAEDMIKRTVAIYDAGGTDSVGNLLMKEDVSYISLFCFTEISETFKSVPVFNEELQKKIENSCRRLGIQYPYIPESSILTFNRVPMIIPYFKTTMAAVLLPMTFRKTYFPSLPRACHSDTMVACIPQDDSWDPYFYAAVIYLIFLENSISKGGSNITVGQLLMYSCGMRAIRDNFLNVDRSAFLNEIGCLLQLAEELDWCSTLVWSSLSSTIPTAWDEFSNFVHNQQPFSGNTKRFLEDL